jgi:hypothetical protein
MSHKSPISWTRTADDDIEMMDGRGVPIFVRPDATIADLVKAGARNISIVSPDAPPVPHHYRSGSGTKWKINDLSHGFTRVESGKPDIKIPGEVCEFIAKMPDVARYRQIYGDRGLSTEIVKVIIDCMDVEEITQEAVDRFAMKMKSSDKPGRSQ